MRRAPGARQATVALEALRARRLVPRALFLVGELHDSNRETPARRSGLRAIFELPRLDELNAAALDDWLDENPLDELFEL